MQLSGETQRVHQNMKLLAVTNLENKKSLIIECETGEWKQVSVLVFPDYADYDKLQEGQKIDGYIRTTVHGKTLTDWCKPDRLCKEGESFFTE